MTICLRSLLFCFLASIYTLAGADTPECVRVCKPSSGRPIVSRPVEIDTAWYAPFAKPPADKPAPEKPKEEKPAAPLLVKVKPYGYTKIDIFYDSRQVVGTRENQVLYFPAAYLPDIHGRDINAHGQFHMTCVETRVGLDLEGPTFCGLKTNGIIETDFRGVSEDSIDTLRLRHAFGQILWDYRDLVFLYGQFWHPIFAVDCFPHTLSFNFGAPFEPQARAPQLRVTKRWDNFELIAAIASQRDFPSNGPVGYSTAYFRNARTPNMHAQFRYYFGDNIAAIAGDFKRLTPRIVTDKNYKVDEHIDSFMFEAYMGLRFAPFSVRMKVLYAENGHDQLLISGYGVRTVNPVTDRRTYANTAAPSVWLDASYTFHCDHMELGLFLGYTKNLGARCPLYIDPTTKQPIIYSLLSVAQNIDYVGRVSPRFLWAWDPVRVGVELEVTRASYGTINTCGRIINPCPVTNVRLLFGGYYVF